MHVGFLEEFMIIVSFIEVSTHDFLKSRLTIFSKFFLESKNEKNHQARSAEKNAFSDGFDKEKRVFEKKQGFLKKARVFSG